MNERRNKRPSEGTNEYFLRMSTRRTKRTNERMGNESKQTWPDEGGKSSSAGRRVVVGLDRVKNQQRGRAGRGRSNGGNGATGGASSLI